MSGETTPQHVDGDGANGDDGHERNPQARRTTADAPDVVRRMAAHDRATHPQETTHSHPAGSTASADAVDQVRRSLTDLKHDVRMLKVGLDKQGANIDRLVSSIEKLAERDDRD